MSKKNLFYMLINNSFFQKKNYFLHFNFSLGILFCSILFLCSCINGVPKRKQKKYNYKNNKRYYITNKKNEKKADISKYINTNLASTTLEEATFLEDLELKFQPQGNTTIAIGRKIYTQNLITSQLMPWDRKDLMDNIGICRSKQTALLADIADDGMVNYSAKDACLVKQRHFTKGKMRFQEVSFVQLEDWHGDDFKDALYAFLQSCKAYTGNKLIQSKTMTIGTEADWRELCLIGAKYYKVHNAKAFFERYFSPFKVTETNGKDTSKFTGYYIWELPVSLEKTDKYWYPIYSMPIECKLSKRCPTRTEVNLGALSGRGLELAWASNPMDVYFMQVQGSGIGVLENGRTIRFNYAGKNDKPFKSYSEYIKKHPKFCPVSGYGNTIAWLNKNPDKAITATNISDSYVFFVAKSGLEPAIGSQGVPLTQSRSIAIDPTYIPYGVPMWIETHIAVIDTDNHDDDKWVDWNRLYIAQDTGSAIKGVVRADLYMGHGKKGEFIAKNQNFPGKWYMLIPNSLVEEVMR